MKQILKKFNIEEEKTNWENGIFIFDSSVLLNFYDYSKEAIKVLDKKIFHLLKGRLWITNQTEYEYLKNRERVLLKPEKLYDDLAITYFDIKKIQNIKNDLIQLQNRTKKQDKHPHINQDFFKKFESEIEIFENQTSIFLKQLSDEITLKKKDVQAIKNNDTIQKIIFKHFKITEGYNFEELINIAKEGEFRYRNTIPPGYADLKDKIGLQIYGDLIIWKQILDLANNIKKPIILIIDDLKIDWCYQNNKDKNLIEAPREELIKEMQDQTGISFSSYSSTQFLQKSKEIFNISITEEIINEANKANQYNIAVQVETAVYEWAVKTWGDLGEIIKTNDSGPDVIVSIDSIKFAIEIKYYSDSRKQSIRSLIERLHPRFEIKNYYEKYEEVAILIVCESIDQAQELKKQNYELPHDILAVRFGYLNKQKEFVILKEQDII